MHTTLAVSPVTAPRLSLAWLATVCLGKVHCHSTHTSTDGPISLSTGQSSYFSPPPLPPPTIITMLKNLRSPLPLRRSPLPLPHSLPGRSKVTLPSLSVWRKFTQNRRWTDGRKKEEVALRITMTFGNCRRTDGRAGSISSLGAAAAGTGVQTLFRTFQGLFSLLKITRNKIQRQRFGRASFFIPLCSLVAINEICSRSRWRFLTNYWKMYKLLKRFRKCSVIIELYTGLGLLAWNIETRGRESARTKELPLRRLLRAMSPVTSLSFEAEWEAMWGVRILPRDSAA